MPSTFPSCPPLLLPYSSKKITFKYPAFCRAKRAAATTTTAKTHKK